MKPCYINAIANKKDNHILWVLSWSIAENPILRGAEAGPALFDAWVTSQVEQVAPWRASPIK